MMRVKGTMVLDYVKAIRANKDRDWSKWLSPEELEQVNEKIFQAAWYPFGFYQNVAFAVFKEIGKSNLDIALQSGRLSLSNLVNVYKNSLLSSNPVESVQQLVKIHQNLVEGGHRLEVVEHGDTHVRCEVSNIGREVDKEKLVPFQHHMCGLIAELVERSGGKNVTTKVEPRQGGYVIFASWG